MWNLKTDTDELIYKQKQSYRCGKLMVTRGQGKRVNWEIETDVHILVYIKQITNKDLPYSTGNSTHYSVIAYMGKESKKRVDICICITDSLCCTAETNNIISTIPQ